MNECLFDLDKCEDTCINTPGSYRCSCPYGQVLASNGYSCIECAANKGSTNFSQVLPIMPRNINESSWHVAICTDNSTVCSGSLINDNLILTTASCVCNDEAISTESISVKLNKNYGCSTDETNEIEYGVSQIMCHPLYKKSKPEHNIALSRLDVIINATSFAPVCLPDKNTDTDIFTINNFVGIYGFREPDRLSSSADGSGIEGSTKHYTNNSMDGDDNLDELYLQVTQIVNNADCNSSYNYSLTGAIRNLTICTG